MKNKRNLEIKSYKSSFIDFSTSSSKLTFAINSFVTLLRIFTVSFFAFAYLLVICGVFATDCIIALTFEAALIVVSFKLINLVVT